MSNIYKYRVDKKWYTFDKSILDPQDVRVFDLANWSDKLKIITIYQDLKTHDDDDVIILKTKKENPNKDKRAAEYRAKRQKLESDLVEANKRAQPGEELNEEQARLIKQLNDLDIQYADVVNIQNAETVNITKANQVILNNVDELIKQTNTKLDQLRTSLTPEDFNTIKTDIKALLNAKTENQMDDSVAAIQNTLEKFTNTTLMPAVQNSVNTMLSTVNKLREALNDVAEMEIVKQLIEYGFFNDIEKDDSYLTVMSKAMSQMNDSNISQEDLTTLSEYPYAVQWLRREKAPLKLIHQFCDIIRMFDDLLMLRVEEEKPQIGFIDSINGSPNLRVIQKFKHNITSDDDFKNFINKIEISNDTKKFYLFKKYPNHNAIFIKRYEFKLTDKDNGTYKTLTDVIKSERKDEEEKPGAVEGQGFLGLKTSKSAKQDYEELKREITTLKKQIDEMTIEINNLRNMNVSITGPDTPEPETVIIQDSQRPTTVPSFLTDLNKRKDQLKHAEPITKQPELTDLQKLLNRRRQDIAPDEYEEEEEEDWGEGLGGILGELQRDLNKYGLVLSLSPDGKAYFVNVYNKKGPKARQGNGVAEANTLVNSVNENTEYKDLKKLYESLY